MRAPQAGITHGSFHRPGGTTAAVFYPQGHGRTQCEASASEMASETRNASPMLRAMGPLAGQVFSHQHVTRREPARAP